MAYSSTSDAFRKLVLMGFLLLLCCAPAATAARAEGAGIPDDVILTARSDTELVRRYAEQLLEENRKDNYAHGGFTWDTEGRETSWRYFNGFMADALLRNPDFRADLLSRAGELIPTALSNERILEEIDRLCAVIDPEVSRDYQFYEMFKENWEWNVNWLKDLIISSNWDQTCIDQLCFYLQVTPEERALYFPGR